MKTRLLRGAACAAAAALLAAACATAPEELKQAQKNFDALPSVKCPAESRQAIARAMGAKSAGVHILHYGPTGKKDATCYFAGMNRDGKFAVGIIDEAWAKIVKVHYQGKFAPEDFPWVVKCLRNDPPFADRQYRHGIAFPVEVVQQPRDVAVEFVDGWLPSDQDWSSGSVKVNLAGTVLLDERHTSDFAFRPS